jgi:hypothetical protein
VELGAGEESGEREHGGYYRLFGGGGHPYCHAPLPKKADTIFPAPMGGGVR